MAPKPWRNICEGSMAVMVASQSGQRLDPRQDERVASRWPIKARDGDRFTLLLGTGDDSVMRWGNWGSAPVVPDGKRQIG